MSATQMNTRIDNKLKSRGDAVLKSIDLTPSQAVRWLWEYLDAHAGDSQALECLRANPRSVVITKQKQTNNASEQVQSAHSVIGSIQNFRESIGLDESYSEPLSDKELLEEALYERLQDRGLA